MSYTSAFSSTRLPLARVKLRYVKRCEGGSRQVRQFGGSYGGRLRLAPTTRSKEVPTPDEQATQRRAPDISSRPVRVGSLARITAHLNEMAIDGCR